MSRHEQALVWLFLTIIHLFIHSLLFFFTWSVIKQYLLIVGPRMSSLFSCNTSCMEHHQPTRTLLSPPTHCAHVTIAHYCVALYYYWRNATCHELHTKFLEVAPILYTQVLMLSHHKQRLLDHNQVDPQLTVGVKAFLFGPLIDACVNTCIIHKALIYPTLTADYYSFPLPLIPLINHTICIAYMHNVQ